MRAAAAPARRAPSPANARGAGRPQAAAGAGGSGARWAPSRGSPARTGKAHPAAPGFGRSRKAGGNGERPAARRARLGGPVVFVHARRTQAALERGMALPAVLARVAVLPHAFPLSRAARARPSRAEGAPAARGRRPRAAGTVLRPYGSAVLRPCSLAVPQSCSLAALLPPATPARRASRSRAGTGGGTRRCTRRRQQARGCPCSWPPRRSRRCPARRR